VNGNSYIATGLDQGLSYQFRVTGKNKHGNSVSASPVATFTASSIPLKMATPTTSNNTINAQITWVAGDGQGQAISQYLIQIQGKDGTFYSQTNYCPGTDVSVLSCNVPYTVLRATPYNLVLNDLVIVRVSAKNSNGWGSNSDASTGGASIQTEPGIGTQVVKDAATTESTLKVTFTAVTSTGGSPIISYHLQYKLSSSSTWQNVKGLSPFNTDLFGEVNSGIQSG
jgi:hypothetical protein